MNGRLSRFSGLSLCILFNLLTLSAIEQFLSDKGYKSGYSNGAIAQTAEEQIGRNVYQKASPGVVTVKDGRGHGSGFVVSKAVFLSAFLKASCPSLIN